MKDLTQNYIPIQPISYSSKVDLWMKREDLIHEGISGNKFWKLYYNVIRYLDSKPKNPMLISFGGAFSNHIAALAVVGKQLNVPTLGIIRGEELATSWPENATLRNASEMGMVFHFVSREDYRAKDVLTKNFKKQYPDALVIPEGGSNELAVQGIKMMLDNRTKDFDYLCTAVGTGGTVAGLSLCAEIHQKILGFQVVRDESVTGKVRDWSSRQNITFVDAAGRGYAKITEELVDFINDFYEKYTIPLDPIYTGKMMQTIFRLIDEDYFPVGSRILAFHTGGLQAIEGMNANLISKNKRPIQNQ